MARTKQTARKMAAPRKTLRRQNTDLESDPEETTVIMAPDMDPEKLKAIEEGEMQAELKHIDKKFTDKGQAYFTETVDEVIPEQVNWWSKFALCLVRHTHPSDPSLIIKTTLQINSQHLKDILKDTIDSYPGCSFQTKDISIDKPYHALYHYRHELEDVYEASEADSEASSHLKLLLDFVDEEFKETIEDSDNFLEQGLMSYSHLWTVFKPGSTIYAPIYGQARAFTLQSYRYSCDPPGLDISLQYVDFDGEDFGTAYTSRLVRAFQGAEPINSLSAYPIEWHLNPDAVRQQLVKRGRKWEQHAGMDFCCYNGIALQRTPLGVSRYNVDGRIVVDTKTSHRLNANYSFSVVPFKPDIENEAKRRRIHDDDEDTGEALDLVPEEKLDLDPLTDEQCLLANAVVKGFSFSEKEWFEFFIDKVSSPDWNSNCFNQLVLTEAQKDLVRALVATHAQKSLGFDDIVKGKGKGLIMVLHGPPGVGKTLTAETVAEYCKRPLYMVSSGDLGTNSSTLDQRLSRILDMASTWKAVLLIDEADVFLERRSLHDMERNSLVSIFLRVLEYYEGILFLTSNRVSTFDDAFKSRIHVPLKYNDLTVESRKQIWRNFLSKMDNGAMQLDDAGYESLAQANINGRQIKNVIRTAKSLAQFHGKQLDQEKLQQVIKIQIEFEEELERGMTNGGDEHMVNGN
ncbi:Hypothetical protein R9X50_00351900 [Acrodontium crateriforme]|uniref:AAA+ ATPase domain-containing protein n=1 Tax=Acrodontium crateriforme TaxID=150365 RepID=A0AAQ3R7I7_9PEZI|nr:Hypothetical protein R9X50_00351900 [Acrodontium crateriforme]